MPTVVLVTEPFAAVAHASAQARRAPKLPIVVFQSDLDELDPRAVERLVSERLADVRDALMRAG